MPLNTARTLIGRERSYSANLRLGLVLSFVAGALNAGGFLAVNQYTSHMTGIVSAMADNLVLGAFGLVLAGLGALLSFLSGAISTSILVSMARRRRLHSEYALPLLIEAALLLCFGLVGARLQTMQGLFVPLTVMLLCFTMGLQNALISKISKAGIRTTHITGNVTDIGVELGRLIYWNRSRISEPKIISNRKRLKTLTSLTAAFFVGGVVGAVGFTRMGYLCVVPLALTLVGLAGVPTFDDLRVSLLAVSGRSRRG